MVAQKDINEMRKELKSLQLENASLLADQTQGKRRRSKKDAPAIIPEHFLEHLQTIKTLGQKFGILGEIWVDSTVFGVDPPAMMTPNSQDRYRSPASIMDGVVAELFAFVPPQFHDAMRRSSWFGETVCNVVTIMTVTNHMLV